MWSLLLQIFSLSLSCRFFGERIHSVKFIIVSIAVFFFFPFFNYYCRLFGERIKSVKFMIVWVDKKIVWDYLSFFNYYWIYLYQNVFITKTYFRAMYCRSKIKTIIIKRPVVIILIRLFTFFILLENPAKRPVVIILITLFTFFIPSLKIPPISHTHNHLYKENKRRQLKK